MKNISEIFDDYEKAETDEDRINVLHRNDCFALRQVLKGTFDPNVEFVIERVPYYKPSDAPAGLGYTTINTEMHRAYLFQKDHPKANANLSPERREKILIQMLEAMEAREAEIFMNMLLKKQVIKGLNAKIVKEAYPDLF
jgi:hypothetical protein